MELWMAVDAHNEGIDAQNGVLKGLYSALQRQFRLYIPFLGIARPQPQFPHSCVFELFIYSQARL
jgi:hypothetical protein